MVRIVRVVGLYGCLGQRFDAAPESHQLVCLTLTYSYSYLAIRSATSSPRGVQ